LRVLDVPGDPENLRELKRGHLPLPSYFLLRPDGHVALAGINLDVPAIARYLRERLLLAPDA